MMRIILLIIYLSTAYMSLVVFCGIEAMREAGGGNFFAGVVYYPAMMLIHFWATVLIVLLISPKARLVWQLCVFVLAGVVLLAMSSWMFNPDCRYFSIWQQRCLMSVIGTVWREQSTTWAFVVAHALGCIAWLALKSRVIKKFG
jgi:hypothetical protein